jgi:hypothetical protein
MVESEHNPPHVINKLVKVLIVRFHQNIFVEFLHAATVTLMGDQTLYNGQVIQESTRQIIC